jgi:hypothetical protein
VSPGWATDWSPTSALLQHAWITWVTRGLYAGYRRVNLNTQIDDMFLESDIYSPSGTTFRLRPADLTAHGTWTSTINAKMNTGSAYFIEIGHNGNGNIEASDNINDNTCSPGPIEYPEQIDTPLEFQKPLGSGTNLWPATPTTYPWSTACVNLDNLKTYFATASNRDKFAHISHTFTHEEVNNATYSDVYKEISFNQAWLKQVTISAGSRFTANGLIPPAITGLHNGDAISAWVALGLVHAVGDNTRPVLRNQANDMWPYMTTMSANGYDNFTVLPRWATRIYYNCDLPNCTVAEWVATSAGTNDYNALLATEKTDTMRHLFGLYHDGKYFQYNRVKHKQLTPSQHTCSTKPTSGKPTCPTPPSMASPRNSPCSKPGSKPKSPNSPAWSTGPFSPSSKQTPTPSSPPAWHATSAAMVWHTPTPTRRSPASLSRRMGISALRLCRLRFRRTRSPRVRRGLRRSRSGMIRIQCGLS